MTAAETAAYFDRAASQWDSRSHFRQTAVEMVFDLVGRPAGAGILDVGCGTGVLFPTLLSFRPRHVTGLDLSAGMLREARRKFPESRTLSIVQGDFYSFTGGPYDLITVYNAYPHFSDRQRFLRQAYNLLTAGGRLLVLHDLGRDRINACHQRTPAVCRISSPLRSCEEELVWWRDLFRVDLAMDEPDLYVLSGING